MNENFAPDERERLMTEFATSADGTRIAYDRQGSGPPVILVDGAIAGVWKHERKSAALTVELSPFAPLPDWATEQLRAEADRLADFLGGPLVFAVEP